MLIYLLYRFALSNPNSSCYYIAPFQKQAKELIWANGRIQNFFLPLVDDATGVTHSGHTREETYKIFDELKEKYGVKVNDSEMRIKFANGSFIKLDGADNHQAYRGINPHIIVYDEFKDHHPKFHAGMDPNLATFDAPLIVVGTPPEGDEDNEEQFVSLANYAAIAPHGAYFNFPTYLNPYIQLSFLKRKKEELFARGEEDKWFREYMAKRVKSGSRTIFPMLEVPPKKGVATKHVYPKEWIKDKFFKRKKDYDIFLGYDPASASVFAVLLVAINRYTKEILILDEIYETKKKEMSTGVIFPKSLKLLEEWRIIQDEVRFIYDNAATWFSNEVAYSYGFQLEPCMKDIKNKESRLSLIKDALIRGYFFANEECTKFLWEMENYRVDESGKIPKENDHAIDTFRYILSNAYYNEVPMAMPDNSTERRGYRLGEEFDKIREFVDPFERIYREFYE